MWFHLVSVPPVAALRRTPLMGEVQSDRSVFFRRSSLGLVVFVGIGVGGFLALAAAGLLGGLLRLLGSWDLRSAVSVAVCGE